MPKYVNRIESCRSRKTLLPDESRLASSMLGLTQLSNYLTVKGSFSAGWLAGKPDYLLEDFIRRQQQQQQQQLDSDRLQR